MAEWDTSLRIPTASAASLAGFAATASSQPGGFTGGGGETPLAAGCELFCRRGAHRPPKSSRPTQKEPAVGSDAPNPFSCQWVKHLVMHQRGRKPHCHKNCQNN